MRSVRRQTVCRWKLDQAGVTLLEILIAVSILGICFSALFSGFSTALRATDRIDRYGRAVEFATSKLNELLVDPTLRAGEVRAGTTASGLRWRARTEVADQRPGSPDQSPQLLHVVLEVSWPTRSGSQGFVLESLKLRLPQTGPNF